MMPRLVSADRGRCPFGALHLILEDSLLPMQSPAATNGPNIDRMGRSDCSYRTHKTQSLVFVRSATRGEPAPKRDGNTLPPEVSPQTSGVGSSSS
jgi:hypothetical protein